MFKITFLGAGSTTFAKNVLGDCILTPELGTFEIALHDIDLERLEDSKMMLEAINKNHQGKAIIKAYENRKEALKDAKYVVNAVQIGGYDPSTIIDFEIPKKYGLRQTIGDTLGIGGIFRALRTIPFLESVAKDMHEVCPNALMLNYVNPMSILTGYMLTYLDLNVIGLCHSVQWCVEGLFKTLKLEDKLAHHKAKIAGINHQAWLLEIKDENDVDLYPEIKKRSKVGKPTYDMNWDLVRHDILSRFGYYNTESSEHTAEYNPWYIKKNYPELIERYKIPLDEYPRRCIEQINEWKSLRKSLVENTTLIHEKSVEFASYIIKAMELDIAYRVHGNVLNKGLITNLPAKAVVEVPCLIDQNGVNPCYLGELPEVLAAINQTHVNVHILTMEAAKKRSKEAVYQAAYLDPHTASELSLDEIKAMCDELFEAHKEYLYDYK